MVYSSPNLSVYKTYYKLWTEYVVRSAYYYNECYENDYVNLFSVLPFDHKW